MTKRLGIAVAALFLSAGAQTPHSSFSQFVDDYFDAQFAFSPSSGTAAGFHQYDNRIEDFSRASFERRIATLHTLLARLDRLRAGALSADDSIDAEALNGAIRSELLDLETLETWRHNPMQYAYIPGGAVDLLMKRNFAPARERLMNVIARLEGIPAIVAAMKANIDNPPREFTDLAQRMMRGSVGFFDGSVAKWAHDASGGDAAVSARFQRANAAAMQALKDGSSWIEKELQPRSKGNYAIGSDNFRKKLLYDEMVDLSLERVLAIGEANLAKDHQAFIDTARRIDASKGPMEVMRSLSNDRPSADDLVPFAKATLEKTRQFLIDHQIVTVPSEVRPIVTETPPYARSGVSASMDTPGAYETKATEAYYYVTPPEADWTAKQVEEHLRQFNRPVMGLITIHEAFPGHYLQFLYVKQFPTKTRKLTGAGTNVEGWAHYSEQMMLEEGFGNGDPKIRLAQLSEALTRDCRYVAGIKLHTSGMTVEQAKDLFVTQCFQEPQVSFEEARRGTYNPTYLYYTLGKLEIYKLREDYRKARGGAYRLKDFHDAFVKQGGLPIPLLRRILLPGDKGGML
jgi:uncharacterized protein (DUF885 family)